MEEEPKREAIAPLETTFGERGISIRNMADLSTFALMVVKAGFAPKGLEQVPQVAIAIQLGQELGLSPMRSLQNIAVINGKPCIYGDAATGLVNASGLLSDQEEWWEIGEKKISRPPAVPKGDLPDDLTRWVRLERVGRSAPIMGSFSVADAKRAKLWDKQGPWAQYPTRMLEWRARSFAYRDGFADVLCGLQFAEEVRDIPRTVEAEVKGGRSLSDMVPADDEGPVIEKASDEQIAIVDKLAEEQDLNLFPFIGATYGVQAVADLTAPEADHLIESLRREEVEVSA